MTRQNRGPIPIPIIVADDVVVSARIDQGVTQNHIAAIGKAKRPPAKRKGRALRAEGRSFAICTSHTLDELRVLDEIAAIHNTTRSEAIRVAARFYIAHLINTKGATK